MSDPISLVERRAAPAVQSVVAILEGALDAARAGKTKGVVLIEVDHADDFRCRSTGDLRLTQTIGLLEVAKHDALEAERARPPAGEVP